MVGRKRRKRQALKRPARPLLKAADQDWVIGFIVDVQATGWSSLSDG